MDVGVLLLAQWGLTMHTEDAVALRGNYIHLLWQMSELHWHIEGLHHAMGHKNQFWNLFTDLSLEINLVDSSHDRNRCVCIKLEINSFWIWMGWLSNHLCIWVQPGGLHVGRPRNWFIDFYVRKCIEFCKILWNSWHVYCVYWGILQNLAEFHAFSHTEFRMHFMVLPSFPQCTEYHTSMTALWFYAKLKNNSCLKQLAYKQYCQLAEYWAA